MNGFFEKILDSWAGFWNYGKIETAKTKSLYKCDRCGENFEYQKMVMIREAIDFEDHDGRFTPQIQLCAPCVLIVKKSRREPLHKRWAVSIKGIHMKMAKAQDS